MIKSFLKDTDWGDLDYLIIDTPPGLTERERNNYTHLYAHFNTFFLLSLPLLFLYHVVSISHLIYLL